MRYRRLRLLIAAATVGAGVVTTSWPGTGPSLDSRVVAAVRQDEQRPVFRGGTTFVSVDVYPRHDGQVIEGLTKDDFEITEDGKPQSVETFQFIKYETAIVDAERRDPTSVADSERQAADPRNRLFVIYLDPYSTKFENVHTVESAARAFLTRTIGSADMFALMTPEALVSSLTFGRRLETFEGDLKEFADSVRIDGSKKDRPRTPLEMKLSGCVPADAFVKVVGVLRRDLLMTNLENLVARLGGLREELKTVLLFSEGWGLGRENPSLNALFRSTAPTVGVNPRGRLGINNQPTYQPNANACAQAFGRLGSIDFEQRFRDLLTRARRANVSFFTVDVAGLRVAGGNLTLRTLAENTDGLSVRSTNDVIGGVRKLTNSLSAVYLLGYYSTNAINDGKYREIKVRVRRPNVDVAARPGYLAPTAALAAAASRPRVATVPTPVDEELQRLARARPDADLFSYGAALGDQLAVVVELSSGEMESGRWKTGADVRATAQTAGGAPATVTATIEPGARAVALTLPTAGHAGPWTVDVRVSRAGNVLDSAATVTRATGAAQARRRRAVPSRRAHPCRVARARATHGADGEVARQQGTAVAACVDVVGSR
jgi:VWFA-related protein